MVPLNFMRKLICLFFLMLIATCGAFAQQSCDVYSLGLDPGDPLTPYYIYMCEQTQGISSPGMLPCPGCPPVNQQPQSSCAPQPQRPNPEYVFRTSFTGGLIRVYYELTNVGYNPLTGCTIWEWLLPPGMYF